MRRHASDGIFRLSQLQVVEESTVGHGRLLTMPGDVNVSEIEYCTSKCMSHGPDYTRKTGKYATRLEICNDTSSICDIKYIKSQREEI
jgi:hypothetical protein